MSQEHVITTERLEMVPFAPEHLEGLFALNSDPAVMRYLGGVDTRDKTRDGIARQQVKWAKYGFGWWSVFERDGGALIGAACLQHLGHVEINPLEIGWRLRPEAQSKGYATEAGRAAMEFGFDVIGVTYLTSVANPANTASRRVMERLGMRYVGVQVHYDAPCAFYEIYRDQSLL